jgi:hypothetical protein
VTEPFLRFNTDGQPHEVFASMLEAIAQRLRDTPTDPGTSAELRPTYEEPNWTNPEDILASPVQKGWNFKLDVTFLTTRPGTANIRYEDSLFNDGPHTTGQPPGPKEQ